MYIKRTLSLLLTLVLIMTVGAAGAVSANTEPAPDQKLPQDAEMINIDYATVIPGVNYNLAVVSPLEAFDIFMKMQADANVTELKLETEDDQLEYKVEAYDDKNEYELRISAISGEVLKYKMEKQNKNHKDGGIVTREDIAKVNDLVIKAMDKAGSNMRFKEWEAEEFDDILKFEIEFKNAKDKYVEYIYKLRTGELLKIND